MSETIVIFTLSFMTLLGLAVIYLFDFLPDHALLAKIPYAFGLGCGLLAIYMFELGRSAHWQYPQLLFLPASLIMLTFILKFKKTKVNFKFKPSLLLFLIFLQVLYTGFEVWLRPLSAWDGWASWLLKAKTFYLSGYFNPDIFHLIQDTYPYVINLTGTFIYYTLGHVNDRTVLLFFYFVYLMLGLHFFQRTKSLLFTFLFLSLQNVIRHGGRFEAGYADLTLGFYIFLCFSLLQNYLKSRKFKNLLLLSIFMGITSLIKEEGWVFAVILEIIIFYRTRRLALLWLIPFIDWRIFKHLNHITYTLYPNPILHLTRLPNTLLLLSNEFLNLKNWNLAWPAFFVTLAVFWKKINKDALFIITAQITAYILVFLISPHSPSIHVPNVIDRLFLHFIPLLVYIVCVVNTDIETGAATSPEKKKVLSSPKYL